MGFCCFGGLYRFVICIDYRLIQTLRAYRTPPYTLVLKFVPLQVGCVAQPRTRLVEMQAMADSRDNDLLNS